MLILKRIISGGQTGADLAGLVAAKSYELETGGYAPKNFMTEDGPDYSLKEYGLIELENYNYRERTIKNVEECDGVVIIGDPNSTGSKLTAMTAAGIEYETPYLHIPWSDETADQVNDAGQHYRALAHWIVANGIETLNVAGNRESRNPGIFEFTLELLEATFEALNNWEETTRQENNPHEN